MKRRPTFLAGRLVRLLPAPHQMAPISATKHEIAGYSVRMKTLSVLFMVTLLTGCRLDLPAFDAGTLAEFQADGRVVKSELSDFQIKTLSEWLHTHQDGWEFRVEDTAPRLMITLKRGGAIVAVANIGEREIKIKDLVRVITPDERARLGTILTSFIDTKKKAEKSGSEF
jgi:hypothetical protein